MTFALKMSPTIPIRQVGIDAQVLITVLCDRNTRKTKEATDAKLPVFFNE